MDETEILAELSKMVGKTVKNVELTTDANGWNDAVRIRFTDETVIAIEGADVHSRALIWPRFIDGSVDE